MQVLIKQELAYAKRQNSILSSDDIPKQINSFCNLFERNTQGDRLPINPADTTFLTAINTCNPLRGYSKKSYKQSLIANFSWPTSEIVGGGSDV